MLLWLLNHIPSIVVHTFVAVGLVLYFFGNSIPIPNVGGFIRTDTSVKILGVILFTFGIYLEGLTTGAGVLESEIQSARQEVARITEQSKQITEKVVIKYVTEQKQVKEKGEQIVKYITTNNDKQCTVYGSTVELLNSAAENRIPDSTRSTNDTAAGVELSAVTKTVIENYNLYNQVSLQLTSLQDWVKQQKENNK